MLLVCLVYLCPSSMIHEPRSGSASKILVDKPALITYNQQMTTNSIELTKEQIAMLVGIALANPAGTKFTVVTTHDNGIGAATQVLVDGQNPIDITDFDSW